MRGILNEIVQIIKVTLKSCNFKITFKKIDNILYKINNLGNYTKDTLNVFEKTNYTQIIMFNTIQYKRKNLKNNNKLV